VLRQGKSLDRLGDDHRRRGRLLLYHLSIGSPVADVFGRRPEGKLVNYHNITPAELVRAWEPEIGEELRWGRTQMRQLAPVTSFAFADSAFNASELDDVGYAHAVLSPLLIDPGAILGDPDSAVMARLARDREKGGHDILFVGKISPHKAQHDLIKALIVFRRLYDPRARLRLVGSSISPIYSRALERLTTRFGVSDAVDFAGTVTRRELIAYYKSADVFVCLSDHEGFCVPLIEAMVHRVPVVALGKSAVPDTVRDAGLVLAGKDPVLVSAAIHRIIEDEVLRASLAAAALVRVESLSLVRSEARVTEVVTRAVEFAEADSVV